ncbi:MAG: flagellar hook-basal body complex protein FliE [Pseudomonadota bacterium]
MSITNADAMRAYAGQVAGQITGAEAGAQGAPGAKGVKPVEGPSFADELGKVVQDAIETAKVGEQKAADAVSGQGDLVDVVTAISAAEVTLETVVAVRDRVIGAYQEIMRMPI